MEEEEESDTCSWGPKVAISRPTRPIHRRSASANEVISRNAKRAHTVVVSLMADLDVIVLMSCLCIVLLLLLCHFINVSMW